MSLVGVNFQQEYFGKIISNKKYQDYTKKNALHLVKEVGTHTLKNLIKTSETKYENSNKIFFIGVNDLFQIKESV